MADYVTSVVFLFDYRQQCSNFNIN